MRRPSDETIANLRVRARSVKSMEAEMLRARASESRLVAFLQRLEAEHVNMWPGQGTAFLDAVRDELAAARGGR